MIPLAARAMSAPLLAATGPKIALATGGIAVALLFLVFASLVLRKYIRIMINILDDHAAWSGCDSRELPSLQGEEVSFRAADGQRLEGTIVRGNYDEQPLGMVVFAHEYRSDRTSCMRFCRGLLDQGYDVFAFDFRGHGTSRVDRDYRPRQWPSDREQADMIGAVAFISSWLEQQNRSRDVVLFGVSRGAGASILAAEGISNVRAIICDGVYSSDITMEYFMKRFATIFARIRVVAENHPPIFWRFLRWLFFRECGRRFGCKFPSVLKAVARKGNRPLLMVHGERDSYIPVTLAETLYARAQGPKRLWIVPGAKHNEAIMVHPISYSRNVLAFVSEHLNTTGGAANKQRPAPAPAIQHSSPMTDLGYQSIEPVPIRVTSSN